MFSKNMELTLAIVIASVVTLAYGGCRLNFPPGVYRDKTGNETDEMKVNYTDTVVYGTVLEIKDTKIKGVHDVILSVDCSYKGGVDKKRIHITGVGNHKGQIPGCPTAEVEKGKAYIMFLQNLPPRNGDLWYQINFAPTGGDPVHILDELTFVCGLNLTVTGEIVKNEDICYEPLLPGSCLPYVLPNTTTTSTSTTTMAPTTTASEKETNNNKGFRLPYVIPNTTTASTTTTTTPTSKTTTVSEKETNNNKGTTNVVVGPPKNPEDPDNGGGNGYNTKTKTPAEVVEGSKGDGNSSNYMSPPACLVLLLSIIATLV